MDQTRTDRRTAAVELYNRRAGRRDLLGFTRYTFPTFRDDPFHRFVAQTLTEFDDDPVARLLMLFAPPQHGKSELTSVRYPAFRLGRKPDSPIIITSYGADLADAKSRSVRDIVEGDEFARLFPNVSTRRDSRAVDKWDLKFPNRGSVKAVGMGGPVTGHGATLGIIDDPMENWELSQRSSYRKKVWEWYRGTFRTRIRTGGKIVLIMTRWHIDDLAGKLIQTQADRWKIIRLPAVAESQDERDAIARKLSLPVGLPDPLGRLPGEPLSPSLYPSAELESLKADVGPNVWAAEYQGNPVPLEGTRFKRDWFRIVLQVEGRIVRLVRYIDKAATDGAGCQTAAVLLGLTDDGRVYVLDVVAGHWETDARERITKSVATADRVRLPGVHYRIFVEQEPGSGGVDSFRATAKNLAGFPIFGDKVTGSKDVRLEPWIAALAAGKVFIVAGTWTDDFVEEHLLLPNGPYRDQTDAAAGAYTKLTQATEAGFEWL